jgi:hypothetical protein
MRFGIRRFAVGAALAGVLLAPASGAMAAEGVAGDDVIAIPEGSTLVTPEELALQGATAEEIAHQEDVWASLPADVYTEQLAQSEAEHALYANAFASYRTAPAPLDPFVIAPMIIKSDCTTSAYKIKSTDQAMQCFIGTTGTYTLTTQFVSYGTPGTISLLPGAYKGRVQYSRSTTFYWSTTRGPNDWTWYTFGEDVYDYDDNFRIWYVQFL